QSEVVLAELERASIVRRTVRAQRKRNRASEGEDQAAFGDTDRVLRRDGHVALTNLTGEGLVVATPDLVALQGRRRVPFADLQGALGVVASGATIVERAKRANDGVCPVRHCRFAFSVLDVQCDVVPANLTGERGVVAIAVALEVQRGAVRAELEGG